MHFCRMRTACSLTVSRSIRWGLAYHAPPTTHTPCHAHPPPCMPPAMHAPHPCHACPLPCMPPSTHTPCHARALPCSPSTLHSCPPATHAPHPLLPLPCTHPTTHTPHPLLPHTPPTCHTHPLPATHAPCPCPSLWTEFLTHACKNVTLPQLRCGR